MHGTLTLLRHSLGRLRGLVAAMAVVVALFQVLLVRVAGTLQESSVLAGLPHSSRRSCARWRAKPSLASCPSRASSVSATSTR